MISIEPGKIEVDDNPAKLQYRYQNQTLPSTGEIYKIPTDSSGFIPGFSLSGTAVLLVYVAYCVPMNQSLLKRIFDYFTENLPEPDASSW